MKGYWLTESLILIRLAFGARIPGIIQILELLEFLALKDEGDGWLLVGCLNLLLSQSDSRHIRFQALLTLVLVLRTVVRLEVHSFSLYEGLTKIYLAPLAQKP